MLGNQIREDSRCLPFYYSNLCIVCCVIFQWHYHIDGDGWQLGCSVVHIWRNSSFGMYAVYACQILFQVLDIPGIFW